ncbi:MAG TPA: PKD domain-containing protein [Chitinophagales bacterium]|nr:PKD domain-containing protein [Chitinophagales bacterium]
MQTRTSTLLKIAFTLSALLTLMSPAAFSQCQAGFTWAQTDNNTIQIANTSTGGYVFSNSYTYYWGDGTNSSCALGDTPHIYLSPGTYWACQYMYVFGYLCDSFCTSVTVTGCQPFGADFIIFPDTTMPHHYFAQDLSIGIPPMTYFWSWGDGAFDTAQFPNHTYAVNGYYNICLTTIDSTGCVSNECSYHNLQKLSSAEGENTMVYVQVIGIATGVQQPGLLRSWSIYPNPLAGVGTISYALTSDAMVSIDVYDVQGNKRATLVNGNESEGDHHLMFNTLELPDGIYILQVHAGDVFVSKKIAVMN